MNFREYISQNQFFTTSDIVSLCRSKNNAYKTIQRYKSDNSIKQIKRGLYVSTYGVFKSSNVEPVRLIHKIDSDSVLCLHTALEHYGLSHNLFFECHFYTNKKISSFSFDGFKYIPIFTNDTKLSKPQRFDLNETINITTYEQTIIDCLDKPWVAGGSEEVLKCLLAFNYVDVEQLVEFALNSSLSLRAKTGWLLELNSDKWNVNEDYLEKLKSSLGEGPYYFNYKDKDPIYLNRWALYVPYSDKEVLQWII